MLKQLCALSHLSLSVLVTSGRLATAFLTGGSLPYLLFLMARTTSTEKANLFTRNFSCNSTLDDGSQQLPDFPSRTEQRPTSKKIAAKMISRAIYDLDTSKATGPDRIPGIVLMMFSPELSPILAKLYNKRLAEFCFPSCWKSSSVVPAFKNNGQRSDPGNYRHISLFPIISKIFESFINDSLTNHLDITGLFSDLHLRAIAHDISKAFYKVWHARLLHKLKA